MTALTLHFIVLPPSEEYILRILRALFAYLCLHFVASLFVFVLHESLSARVSAALPRRRQKAAEKKQKQEAAAAAEAAAKAPSKLSFQEEDEQLTMQVVHLHTEKVMLQRRLKELERENDHLQGEVEVLYMQVDEQSGLLDRSFAEAAVEEFISAGLEEAKDKSEAAEKKEESDAGEGDGVGGGGGGKGGDSRSFFPSIGMGRGDKKSPLSASRLGPHSPQPSPSTSSPSAAAAASAAADDIHPILPPEVLGPYARDAAAAPAAGDDASDDVAGADSASRGGGNAPAGDAALSAEIQRRQEDLMESMEALRAERNTLADEVAALRRELDDRHESAESGGELEDMLAKEVEQLLARQAELASNLARVRREKELLEGENDMLHAEANNTPSRLLSERGTSPGFRGSESPKRRGGGGGSVAGFGASPLSPSETIFASSPSFSSSPGRGTDGGGQPNSPQFSRLKVVSSAPSSPSGGGAAVDATAAASPLSPALGSWRPSPARGAVSRKSSVKLPMSVVDGPDMELAAKLIGRLNRAGESDEAQVLTSQVDILLSQQEEMKQTMERFRREKTEMEAEMGRLKGMEQNVSSPMVGKHDGRDPAGAAAAAAEARIAVKEAELAMQLRNLEETVASRVKVAVEEAAARRSRDEVRHEGMGGGDKRGIWERTSGVGHSSFFQIFPHFCMS